jgi:hypothetical protein
MAKSSDYFRGDSAIPKAPSAPEPFQKSYNPKPTPGSTAQPMAPVETAQNPPPPPPSKND